MKCSIPSEMIRRIEFVFSFTLTQFLFSHCYPLSLNNPSDFQSKAYAETQILKCMLNDWDCIEFPQDNQGIKQWSKIIGQSGTYQSYGNSVAVDRYGTLYATGFTSGGFDGESKFGSFDAFLIQYK